MPKNFDELLPKDREFTVRGQTFKIKDVRPEAVSAWQPNGNEELSVWERQDREIMSYLYDDDHERWLKLREREEDPITIPQQNGILQWLFEVATGRPMTPASPSPTGAGKAGARSKDA